MDAKKLQRLKDAADRARREADRAQGAYEQGLKELKDDFGSESVEQAERELKRLERETREEEEEADRKYAALAKKYPDLVEG